MPTIIIRWTWEEAFDKFGFDDGDGLVMTDQVLTALDEWGYIADASRWGLHNYLVTSLTWEGANLLDGVDVGYDDPREYLPADLVAKLDKEFPA